MGEKLLVDVDAVVVFGGVFANGCRRHREADQQQANGSGDDRCEVVDDVADVGEHHRRETARHFGDELDAAVTQVEEQCRDDAQDHGDQSAGSLGA